MLQALDDAAVGRWCRAAVEALSGSRSRLDELNVFPVPDGDTGTNLLHTAEGALAALEQAAPGESTWAVTARGAVLAARGNSGTILAQLMRGLADQLAAQPPAEGPAFAAALQKAADGAYAAVADPEEGTFLTVARASGEAAVAAAEEGRADLADVVTAAADGARAALERTPGQLAVLREAGVVDAGGAGLCLVLDALVRTVTGVEPVRPALALPTHSHRHEHAPHQPPPGPGSEVQYLLADTDEAAVERLQRRLAELGDSLVVVGVDTPTGREWNVHVHVSDIGAAIEAGVEAGRPHRISVTPLAPVRPAQPVPGLRAVVAVVHSDGVGALFAAEGVRVVVCDQDGVTEDDIHDAIADSGAEEIAVLPNDAGLLPVASRAATRAREEGREVGVVPTRSPVQGLAAVAVADPERRFGDDVIAMAEAAAATRWAEVTVADQEALTSAGTCQPGDALGVAEGDVVVIGPDLATVACDLLDRLLSAGGEMATLLVGTDEELGETVCAHLSSVHPTVEVVRYGGGPSSLPLQIGVE
ncbi:dihydroxyacetone kinase [Blastococcus sp. TBT05-19]|uniref:DAK2 domain-containing protein n=1 Tax=Blastococcus sp. TBT05-19 TaxID=2250581 RepID=UPI000DE9C340|nr:DAK2 domain-containing protein [Blastococcus sp. TBT05-19]RBY87131.1 dihydroxyacetone kinase [Blastococcus sp. TBT05-19]